MTETVGRARQITVLSEFCENGTTEKVENSLPPKKKKGGGINFK